MNTSYVDELLNNALRIEKPYCTYENVQRILLDNGIPFYVNKRRGLDGLEITGIEIFECGIYLEKKLEITKQLLHGENCKVTASNEIITITV